MITKKKTKTILITLFITLLLLFKILTLKAAGSATLSVTGPTTAEVGKEITISLNISNLSSGTSVAGIEGQIIFDSNYLEVTATPKCSDDTFCGGGKATNNLKMGGLATDSDQFITKNNSSVQKVTFRALKEGETTISVKDPILSDQNAQAITLNNNSLKVTIGAAKSTNAYVSSLTVTGATYTPTFNKTTQNYSASVANSVSSIDIAFTCEDTKATPTWVSGKTGTNNLNVGDNTFQFRCVAESGGYSTYKLTVKRAAPAVVLSSDNNLKGLSVSGYSISPAFNKDTLEYNVTIPYEATDVIVNAEKNDTKATVNINGNTGLEVGKNVVEITVMAEDGKTKTYKINVTREEKPEEPVVLDSDATLKSLDMSGFTLSPTFKPDINVYSITVQSTVDGLNIDAIPNSDKAKVDISGNLDWEYGMNTVTITVTAENGDKNTYTVNVNRKEPVSKEEPKKSGDSYLKSLSVKGAEINPKFDKDRSSYDITVPYEIDKLDISYIVSDKKAKVEILDNEILQVNKKQTVRIKVTAEDGSVREYTINATRSAMTSNTYLKTLEADGFMLMPLFDKETLNYKLTVKSGTDSLDLTAIAENPNAKVEIFGNNDFKEGKNLVMIRVTDENGFNKIYQIEVEKPAWSLFGMSLWQFLMFTFLGLGLLSLFLIILALLKRNKNEVPAVAATTPMPTPGPTNIEFKPEFNFGSKNGTDDDVVYPNGVLNQGNGGSQSLPANEPKKLVGTYSEANYKNIPDDEDDDSNNEPRFINDENAPFDYFDDTITKDELMAAIREGMATKNTEKLKMLMKQDELNQMKKEIKRKEAAKRSSRSRYDE